MDKRDNPSDPDRSAEPTDDPTPTHNTEDVVFPEWYRKFWRTLLGPWGRR